MTPKSIKAQQLAQVRQLLAYYHRGLIPTLAQHEVNPGLPKGSRENHLYFTLPVCINFQRSSPAMWAAALATYNDPLTRYLFLPERVVSESPDKVRADLIKHKLALQPNKHMLIWTTIAGALHDFYSGDPRQVLAEANHDAGQLVRNLQGVHRRWFPYLSGPKLSNYWPFILMRYTDAEFTNTHEISIIPDTHVLQCSVYLGLVPAGATPLQVEQAWKDLLAGSDIAPIDLHPVLWNWSRNKFYPRI